MQQQTITALTGQLLFSGNQFIQSKITPAIIEQQNIYPTHRKLILDNYRNYIQAYNAAIPRKNKFVNQYNVEAIVHIEQFGLTAAAKKHTAAFNRMVGRCSTEEYNAAALLYNRQQKQPYVQLKPHCKVTKTTEAIFSLIIFKYATQMHEKNLWCKKLEVTPVRSLQKVKINHDELANLTIDSVSCLMMSKRTVQRHVKRLAAAGVLFGYEFKGSNRPVNYHVNSEILVVFDEAKQKVINAQNQLFTFGMTTSCPHNSIVTRTYINKKEIIEKVDNQPSHKKEVSQLSSDNNENFCENTKQHKDFKKNKKEVAPEKMPPVSQYFESKLLENDVFINKLAAGEYANYRKPRNLQHNLEIEAMRGSLGKIEFRELLLQQFLMLAAPIWKDHKNVWQKTWFAAWQQIDDELLLNHNGTVPNKVTQLYYFENLLYRITYAKRYFGRKKDYNALYPSQYFDPTRKTAKSGGFAYTLEALKTYQEYKENAKKRKEVLKAKARQRNMKYRAIELVEKKIKEMVNNKITMPQLFDYVKDNAHIPSEVSNKLPDYIQRIAAAKKYTD